MSRSPSDRIAVALIGAGFIADYHVGGLRAAGGADVAALVGRRREAAEARAAALGIARVETDYRVVLDDPGIDAVVIASPDDTHERIAIDALAAGKAVLLQKPMALDSNQCRAILSAAARASGSLSVSFMHRYFPEVAWLRQLLGSGKLGAVHSVRLRNATPGADWADWFFRPGTVSGGVVMQLGVHGIDLCRHLFGEIDDVEARAATARPERRLADGRTIRTALEDTVAATYGLAGGGIASHEMSYTERAGCDRFRLELYTDAGTVWLRTERGAAAIFAPDATGTSGWVAPALDDAPLGQVHHRHWLDVVRGLAPADGTAEAGLRSVEVAEAIYEAAQTGRRVPAAAEQVKSK
ncbi:putative Inositol 2-dehydrogenase 2 [Hyphomicrobiales bacterium]|nr:putative Inositol 2-dehydrogenase 2 [Hyphomicrobiales bacterium]CAH1702063.1 putative Inositol 2-dehydrogenase 2 [Hyphomicrobiales bacterium]CAI0346220.1 putative Inositol 2-dehydrogenase 2 [Hyphomicrobiales bacterium]